MARSFRVLLADHAASSRAVMRAMIELQTDVVVVGEAITGRDAVDRTLKLHPDIVVLDLHLQNISTNDAIIEIMRKAPRPILVVAERNTDIDHQIAFESLRLGAVKVIDKPAMDLRTLQQSDADEFADLLRALVDIKVIRSHGDSPKTAGGEVGGIKVGNTARPRRPKLDWGPHDRPIVAIGASTGGPQVLDQILSHLPRTFPFPIVLTQHITAGFTDGFVKWLGTRTALEVRVATTGDLLASGVVVVAADRHHLEIDRSMRVRLSTAEPYRGLRPSINVMLASLAEHAGSRTIAVQLTGMGDDGAAGCAAIESAGGTVIVQDPATAIVGSMPENACAACQTPNILPIAAIASTLQDLAGQFQQASGPRTGA